MKPYSKIIRIYESTLEIPSNSYMRKGELVQIGTTSHLGEVLEIKDDVILIQVYGTCRGLHLEDTVTTVSSLIQPDFSAQPHTSILDWFGRPLEGVTANASCLLPNLAPTPSCKISYKRQPSTRLLKTGQNLSDALFPIALGGTAAIIGPYLCGKTQLLNQIALHCEADYVVYLSCQSRTNDIAATIQLLYPQQTSVILSQNHNSPLLIVPPHNASNAYVSCGIELATSICEAWRNQGSHVLLLIDALPQTELSCFDAAGFITTDSNSTGSISVIASISPFCTSSSPSTSLLHQTVGCVLTLAPPAAPFLPRIIVQSSFSKYMNSLSSWFSSNVDSTFSEFITETYQYLACNNQVLPVTLLSEDSSDFYQTCHLLMNSPRNTISELIKGGNPVCPSAT